MSSHSKILIATTVLCGISACFSAILNAQTTNPTSEAPPIPAAAEVEPTASVPPPDETGVPGTDSAIKPDKIEKPEVPYIGKIKGDRVYIRSGPAQV